MQRCLPSDSWGWKATAFRMLNIYGCHFNQNTNLHKKVHDTDHIENVCLAYSVMEKLQKTRAGADVHLGYEARRGSRKRSAGPRSKWLERAASIPEERFPCFPVEKWVAPLGYPLSHPYIWLSSSVSQPHSPSWKWKSLIQYSKSDRYGSFIADNNRFIFVIIVGIFNF